MKVHMMKRPRRVSGRAPKRYSITAAEITSSMAQLGVRRRLGPVQFGSRSHGGVLPDSFFEVRCQPSHMSHGYTRFGTFFLAGLSAGPSPRGGQGRAAPKPDPGRGAFYSPPRSP